MARGWNLTIITLSWTQVEKYIDLMIQSDRYLTDTEKEQRTARQETANYNVGDEVVVDLPTTGILLNHGSGLFPYRTLTHTKRR